MEHILSSTMNRHVKIIELLRVSNDWISLSKIVEVLGAARKTIVTDLEDIETQWEEFIRIEKSSSDGYRLIEKDNHSVQEIFSLIIRDSTSFQLLEYIFYHPGKSREQVAKELYLSSASLYRIVQKMNHELGKRKIKIDRLQTRFIGEDERNIRHFFSAYFFEVYGIHEWPFPYNQKIILSTIDYLNKKLTLKLNHLQMTDLTFLIAISLMRQQQGFLNKKDLLVPAFNSFNEKKAAVYKEAITLMLENLELPWENVDYEDFAYTIFWWEYAWDNQQEQKRLSELGESTIRIIKNTLNLSIEGESKEMCIRLFENVYAYYKTYSSRKYIAYNRELFTSLTIQRDFSIFSKVLKKVLVNLEERTKFPWCSIYYNFILFELFVHWNDLPEQLDQLRHPVSTEVYSDLGPKHAQLLAYYLKKHYREKVCLSIRKDTNALIEKENFSDIYVTNFYTRIIPSEKLFIVEDVPSAKNLNDLGRKIEKQRMKTLSKEVSCLFDNNRFT